MRARGLLVIVAIACCWHATAVAGAPAGFTVRYDRTPNPTHAKLRDALARDRVLERVASELNQMVQLPGAVQITMVSCGLANALYDAQTQRISICYELLDQMHARLGTSIRDAAALEDAVLGAALYTVYHEVGHGLIHQLALPAVGREEDAADQLATLVLLQLGDRGARIALAGARWFEVQARGPQGATPAWGEHALDAQRRYQILCLVYGSDPAKHGALSNREMLPPERAAGCPKEYVRIQTAWQKLLAEASVSLEQ